MIKIHHSLGLFYKNVHSIVRIEALSNYCKIYCSDEKYPLLVAKVLKWFQEQLPQEDFIRIHRSHLVNKNYLSNCMSGTVEFHNGETFRISRRRKKQVFAVMGETAKVQKVYTI